MIRVAMIGFGGIGKNAHFNAYTELMKQGKVKVVAVCDICPEKIDESTKINIGENKVALDKEIHRYVSWKEMLQNEQVDMVDICLPTYLHAPTAVEVLKMGYHVLCEKPMSLSYELCQEMVNAAHQSQKQLMIAQCVRFNGRYRYLKKLIDENTYGKVKSGTFRRLSPPPVWGWNNWFMDYEKSHGCINDLHIHDIDITRCYFGDPKEIFCITQDIYSKKDIAISTLKYDDFSILVVGDWSRESVPFVSDYCVAFEKATVMLEKGIVTVYPRGEAPFQADIPEDNAYYNEIVYFIDLLEANAENIDNPPEESAKTLRLIDKLIESADRGGELLRFPE